MGNPHPIRARFEVLGVRLGFVFIPLMPRCTVLALARFVGAGIYTCSGRNRRVGLANLDIAFGDTKPPTEKKKILRRSIQHFTLSLLDLFWFMRHQAERLDR